MGQKLKYYEIALWFCAITIGMTGSSVFFWNFFSAKQKGKLLDPQYNIVSIIQTGPEKEALKTRYFCELLDLSIDQPTNLYAFNTEEAQRKLLSSPIIKEAEIKKIFPSTLYIDYTLRTPIAWVYDWENLLMDEEGYLFPADPFLTPKELVEIYLGLPPEDVNLWQQPLKNPSFDLAISLFRCLKEMEKEHAFQVRRIDVSNAYSSNFGRREIILLLQHEMVFACKDKKVSCSFPHYLRLSPAGYHEQLGNYLRLLEQMKADYNKQMAEKENLSCHINFVSKTIDLRIDKLAFIEEEKDSL